MLLPDPLVGLSLVRAAEALLDRLDLADLVEAGLAIDAEIGALRAAIGTYRDHIADATP